ncbi:MAG: SHOCT domain-containing protein [Gammaproteobacteria bacterium]|nr:SHOCT domain-containing protein [Gammaproteobacteria bacterium]
MHIHLSPRALARSLALIVVCGLAACSMPKMPKLFGDREPAPDAKVVWNSFDQYVRIEPQDAADSAPPNDHPVQLASAQVKALLGRIELQIDKNEEAKPVFSEAELKTIAPAISAALAKAGPREDIAVAVAGYHSWVYLFNTKRVNTARIFHRDGNLHVIFNKVLGEYVEGEDRRVKPLLPGSRTRSAEFDGQIHAGGSVSFAPGREDWVTVDTRAATGPASLTGATVGRRSEGPAGGGGTARITWGELEQGLESLNRLRQQGLITDQDYETKKKEMLDALGPW